MPQLVGFIDNYTPIGDIRWLVPTSNLEGHSDPQCQATKPLVDCKDIHAGRGEPGGGEPTP